MSDRHQEASSRGDRPRRSRAAHRRPRQRSRSLPGWLSGPLPRRGGERGNGRPARRLTRYGVVVALVAAFCAVVLPASTPAAADPFSAPPTYDVQADSNIINFAASLAVINAQITASQSVASANSVGTAQATSRL